MNGLTDAVQISCSVRGNHVCAARANGGAVCWGHNGSGQLGDGSTVDRYAPVSVTGLTGVSEVSAGSDFSCALLATGSVYCWGDGANGRLGHGNTTSSPTPVPVVAGDTGSGNLTGAVFLASGTAHSCAVLGSAESGRVVCWGYGANGRLGSGGTGDQASPGFVHGIGNAGTCTAANPSGCFSNAVMDAAGDDTTLAIQKGGAASSFGNNVYGESGNGSGGNFPLRVTGVNGTGTFNDAEWVQMGWNHGCGVSRSAGGVCWGAASYGRLGDAAGPGTNEPAPVPVVNGATYTQIDGGDEFSCGLLSAGNVRCWGHNWQGQIGDGTLTDEQNPVDVSGGRNLVAGDSGFDHTCVVSSTGGVYCAGWNADAQLGTSDTNDRWGVSAVQGISDATDVASEQYGTCALHQSGGVACWGYDGDGENGDGTIGSPTVRLTTIDVVGVTNAVQISGGALHTCALVDPPPVGDGVTQVWCWGSNASGQLGDGTTTNRADARAGARHRRDGDARRRRRDRRRMVALVRGALERRGRMLGRERLRSARRQHAHRAHVPGDGEGRHGSREPRRDQAAARTSSTAARTSPARWRRTGTPTAGATRPTASSATASPAYRRSRSRSWGTRTS